MDTDKNSHQARSRRRLAATVQALQDGRVGVEQFEARTIDAAARSECAERVDAHIQQLAALSSRLRSIRVHPCPSVVNPS
jgi:hypothetical protein